MTHKRNVESDSYRESIKNINTNIKETNRKKKLLGAKLQKIAGIDDSALHKTIKKYGRPITYKQQRSISWLSPEGVLYDADDYSEHSAWLEDMLKKSGDKNLYESYKRKNTGDLDEGDYFAEEADIIKFMEANNYVRVNSVGNELDISAADETTPAQNKVLQDIAINKRLKPENIVLDGNTYDDVSTPGMTQDDYEVQRFRRMGLNKIGKLNNRLQKIAAPIIQETGEGIDFRIVKPRQPLEGRTYGFHKVPIHPSNTILIRPKNIEHQMPLIKHFRNIQNKEMGKFVQGSVQQYIPLRNVGGLSSPFGGSLKDYADISKGINQELKKGDILMRRVGGDPSKGKGYGQVGDTFYITKDSPKGELFKYESKYKRRGSAHDLGKKPAFAKLNKRLQKIAERYRAFTNTSSFVGNMRYDQDEQEMTGILSGKHYKWCGVPERTFDAFQGAGSAGAFFNRNVKGQFDCSSGGILTEGQSRISKLKQRVAVIEPLVKKKKKGRVIKKVSPRVAMQDEISKETIRRAKNNKEIPELGLGEGRTYIADIDRFLDAFKPEDADFLNKRYPGKGEFLAIISTTTNIDDIDSLEPYHARLREKGIEALTGFYRNTQTGKLEFDSSYAKRFNSLDEIDPELQVPTEKSPTGQESALVITPDNKATLYFNKKYDAKQVLP